MLTDLPRRYVDFATRNWPTWWQHRLDIPVFGGGALIALALLLVPTFWITQASTTVREQAAVANTLVRDIRQAQAAQRGAECDTVCQAKQKEAIEKAVLRLRSMGIRADPLASFQPAPSRVIDFLPSLDDILISLASPMCGSMALALMLPATLIFIYWLYLVSGSLFLIEAPMTRNQPHAVLLILASIALIAGPFLASGICWSTLTSSKTVWSDAGFLLLCLIGASVGVAFVKLARTIGFFSAVVATGIVLGLIATSIFVFSSSTNMDPFTIIATALYALGACALLVRGRRLPAKLYPLLCAILFYYSAMIGPVLVVIYLDEHKWIEFKPGYLVYQLPVLLLASCILLAVSSYIVDRLSHEPH